MIAKGVSTKFGVALVANETDWDWIPYAPNVTLSTYQSTMMVGNYDATTFSNSDSPLPLDVTTDNGASSWTFDLEQFAFGFTNTTYSETDPMTSYVNLT